MLANETYLLNMVKFFFKCDNMVISKEGSVSFEVKDINYLNKYTIPHFDNYPLRDTKYLDFLTIKKVLDIINSKRHLTEEGISEIVELSNTMNSYITFSVYYSPLHTIKKIIQII